MGDQPTCNIPDWCKCCKPEEIHASPEPCQPSGFCPQDPDSGLKSQAFRDFAWQLVPFIGPSIESAFPDNFTKASQQQVAQCQQEYETQKVALFEAITQIVGELTDELAELAELLGPDQYIKLVAMLVNQPTQQRVISLSITVVTVSIILAVVVMNYK